MKGWKFIKGNIYIKNFFLTIIILVVLSCAILWWLDFYTRHGQAVVVPDVKGLKVEDAAAFFDSKSLRYNVVDSVYNKHVPPGGIVETIPRAGTKVKENRIIFITVNSAGAQSLIIPDIKDRSQRQALAMLKAVGFTKIKVEFVSAAYRDLVIGLECNGKQMYGGEKIPSDALLTLQVSSGDVEPETIDSTAEEVSPEESWY